MRLLLVAAAAVVALVSFFVLGKHFSQPQAYGSVIASLDAKKDTVMNLVGASTGSSAAITVLPGDVGTPIAEKLIDLSSDFMIVLAAIYLEKYLLTVLGFVSFRVLDADDAEGGLDIQLFSRDGHDASRVFAGGEIAVKPFADAFCRFHDLPVLCVG